MAGAGRGKASAAIASTTLQGHRPGRMPPTEVPSVFNGLQELLVWRAAAWWWQQRRPPLAVVRSALLRHLHLPLRLPSSASGTWQLVQPALAAGSEAAAAAAAAGAASGWAAGGAAQQLTQRWPSAPPALRSR